MLAIHLAREGAGIDVFLCDCPAFSAALGSISWLHHRYQVPPLWLFKKALCSFFKKKKRNYFQYTHTNHALTDLFLQKRRTYSEHAWNNVDAENSRMENIKMGFFSPLAKRQLAFKWLTSKTTKWIVGLISNGTILAKFSAQTCFHLFSQDGFKKKTPPGYAC